MLVATILSGGAGTRLWPVSREAHPKPFMKLPDGQSLLQKTYLRAAGLPGLGEILTVTNQELYFGTKEDYKQARPPYASFHESFLLEPFGRNTAPAIALAALKIAAEYGSQATMLVLPADHIVNQQSEFAAAVEKAQRWAREGYLVTFGVVPTAPETGFGYIERGNALGDGTAREVVRFVEKPSSALAQEYLASGRYLWNAGMFCFTVGAFLDQLKAHAPELQEASSRCWEQTARVADAGKDSATIDAQSFRQVPGISIDYALMEKSSAIVVVPATFDWDDVGSWNSVGKLAEMDTTGNVIVGDAVLVDTEDSYIQSDGRVVAAVGVRNLIVIDTPDALLVADRHHAQEVKQAVQELKRRGHETVMLHKTVARPWGTYTVLEEGERFKIKRIAVKPGASLSMQMHHHRSEHWVVVSGTAKVTNNEREYLVRTNESTYISAGHRHRLENPGITDLVIIEVQSGEYLGEDDIVRFDDIYGRA